jgi:hypothetical protein
MKCPLGPLVLALTLAACRADSTGGFIQASLHEADDPPRYSDWSAPANLGELVNTTFGQNEPFITKDRLSLYFQCFNCPGGLGGQDILVSERAREDDPWGPPVILGQPVNSEFNDFPSAVSIDGHKLYMNSNRPGGFGGIDLYVARRRDKRDNLAWQEPANLGSGVNTTADEFQAVPIEDDHTGTITIYFTSNRPGGLGGADIYAATRQPDETFGPAALVAALSSPSSDQQPAIRRDGLEAIVASDRSGTLGGFDLRVSNRANTSEPWSTPVSLGPVINSTALDVAPALSFDSGELYFVSNRPGGFGGFDLYVATRTKLKGQD